jgi:hypothetical protein
VVRGQAGRIKKIADELTAAKGVKHGKLTVTYDRQEPAVVGATLATDSPAISFSWSSPVSPSWQLFSCLPWRTPNREAGKPLACATAGRCACRPGAAHLASPRARRGMRAPPQSQAGALASRPSAQTLFVTVRHPVPVDHVEKRRHVVRAAILIFQIIGMLPNINAEQDLLPLADRRILIGG